MRALALAAALVLVGAGCGDDDAPAADAAVDGRAGDAAADAGDAARPDGARPDASDDGGTDGGAMACGAGTCDLITSDGCGDGQACYFALTDDQMSLRRTCAAAGTAVENAVCTNLNDCAEGLFCQGASEGVMGVCRHYCCIGSDAGCPDGQQCAVQFVDSAGRTTGVGYCVPPDDCNPLAQTGCDMGQGCYLQGQDGTVRCISSASDLNEGQVCTRINDCDPGLDCVSLDASGVFKCHKLCDTTAMPSTCAMTQMCRSLSNRGFANLGVCDPPATGG